MIFKALLVRKSMLNTIGVSQPTFFGQVERKNELSFVVFALRALFNQSSIISVKKIK